MRALMVVQRASMLALIGILAGGAHSAFRPVTLDVKANSSGGGATVPPLVSGAGGGVNGGATVPQNGAGPASTTPSTPSTATTATTTPAELGLEITIPQAFVLFEQGVRFLDARTKAEFEEGHVEGAMHLSSEHFMDGSAGAKLRELDPKAPVVVYCGGGECDASKNLVILLQQAGFTQCHIIHDGMPGWQKAGHPVGTGGEMGAGSK